MTCCGGVNPDNVRTKAAMCETCIFAKRDRRLMAVSCRGKPIAGYIVGGEKCPRGKHPDSAGVVKWVWARWHGVPMPLRLLVWWRLTGTLSGCGCLVVLKAQWLRLVDILLLRRRT